MSPTRDVWKPLRANTRTAASRIWRRFSSAPVGSLAQGRRRVVVASRGMQALGGTLVVDLTRYLPGAFASSELQRLGARVVGVEQPGGDPMRTTRARVARRPERGQGIGRLRPAGGPSSSRRRCSRAPTSCSSRSGPASPRGSASGPATCPAGRSTARSPASAVGGGHEQRAGHDLNYLGWAGLLARHGAGAAAGAGRPTSPPARSARSPRSSPRSSRASAPAQGAHVVVSMTHGSHAARRRARRCSRRASRATRSTSAPTGGRLTVAALEPKFFARLCELLEPAGARGAAVRRRPAGAQGSARGRFLDAAAGTLAALVRRQRTCAWGRSRRWPRLRPISACRRTGRAPAAGAHTADLAAGGGPVIAAVAAAAAIKAEPRDARMLVASRQRDRRARRRQERARRAARRRAGRRVLARRDARRVRARRRPLARERRRQRPAPARGDAERRRVGPTWLPDGSAIVYSATRRRSAARSGSCGCRPGPSRRLARQQRRGVRRRGVATAASSHSSRRAAARRSSTSRSANGHGLTAVRRDAARDAVHRRARPRVVTRREEARLQRRPGRGRDARARRRRRHDADACCTLGRRARSGRRPARGIAFAATAQASCRSPPTAPTCARSAPACRSTGASCPSGRRGSRTSCSGRRAGSSSRAAAAGTGCSASRRWSTTAVPASSGSAARARRGARVMQVRQLDPARRRRHARRRELRRAALRRRAAALPLALPRLRPLRAPSAGDFKLRVRDYKSGFCIADHWGHRDRRPARPAALPRELRAVQPEGDVRRRRLVGRLHRPLSRVLPRPAARHHEAAGRALLARASRERGLPPARDCATATTSPRCSSALTWRGGAPSVTPLRTCSQASAASAHASLSSVAADPAERALELGAG